MSAAHVSPHPVCQSSSPHSALSRRTKKEKERECLKVLERAREKKKRRGKASACAVDTM